MKISRVEIKNFKRFDDLTIDLGESPGRIIALVGPNGCGKSSVLDAFLSLNKQGYGYIGSGASINSQDFKKQDSIPFDPTQSIKVILEGEIDLATSGKFEERITETLGNTLFSFRSPYRYSTNLLKTNLEQVPDIKENSDGAGFTNQLDEKISQNYSRLYVHFHSLQEKEDLPPSEARKRVLGNLNKSLQNCLDLKMTSLGNIMSGKGTLYFKKKDEEGEFD